MTNAAITMNTKQPFGASLKDDQAAEFSDFLDIGISFAFQPIVTLRNGLEAIGHEALVRGVMGQPAGQIIASIRPENAFRFDQACRLRALQVARECGLETPVHLNCTHVDFSNLDHAMELTLQRAYALSFDTSQIVLEFGNLVRLGNPRQLGAVSRRASEFGFRVLADNIGTGDVGLKRLAVFRPDLVKLDREIVNQVDRSPRRQAMISAIIALCRSLKIEVIASGVETLAEFNWLREQGVDLFQGYLFARPGFEEAPEVAPPLARA